jgi:hypothetical protein
MFGSGGDLTSISDEMLFLNMLTTSLNNAFSRPGWEKIVKQTFSRPFFPKNETWLRHHHTLDNESKDDPMLLSMFL